MLSQILLWSAVLIEGLLIAALARQVGILHERIAPAGARHMRRLGPPRAGPAWRPCWPIVGQEGTGAFDQDDVFGRACRACRRPMRGEGGALRATWAAAGWPRSRPRQRCGTRV